MVPTLSEDVVIKNNQTQLKYKIAIVMAIVAVLFIGIYFFLQTWNHYLDRVDEQVVTIAESAEALLSSELVRNLTASPADLSNPAYWEIKSSLNRLAERNSNIRSAYLYTETDGRIMYLVNSQAPSLPGYFVPGQEYFQAALAGKSIVSEARTDRWGTWKSALVPVKDSPTGKVIAVLGIDFPAQMWYGETLKHSVHSAGLIIIISLLLWAVYVVVIRKYALRTAAIQLHTSEEFFRMVFEQAPIGIAIGQDGKLISNINPRFEMITGRTKEELAELNLSDITNPEDRASAIENFAKIKYGEIDSITTIKRFPKPDGSDVWVNSTIAPLHLGNDQEGMYLCFIQDITEHVQIEEALRESERAKSVLLSHLPGMAYRCNYDRDWTMQFVSRGCLTLTGYKPESLLYNREISFNELISPEYRELLWNEWKRVVELKIPFRCEYEITTCSGERKWVLERGQPIYNDSGEVEALEGLIIDITELKLREAQIHYMHEHDFLTGLYNRQFLEREKLRLDKEEYLPLSIIIADINGVRLINDAFGHAAGDRLIADTAAIIKGCCHEGVILARTGGDEFTLLLPHTDSESAFMIMKNILDACQTFNQRTEDEQYHINLSMGYSTKETILENLDQIEKDAEDYMYNSKILNRKSSHNAILASIMATMYARSQETEEHAKRLACLSKKIGKHLCLPEKALDDLELLAMLHDIGKVGIDDRILNKPGQLSDDEWAAMKKHSEIGYRIAMASSDLEPIAEYILYHHERWDGKGYPQGLAGHDIPLLSRILAVADAFDAMTEDRVYRKAMTREAALAEIQKNAGAQFDPAIAELFTNLMQVQ